MRTIKKNTLWRNFLACMVRYERFRSNPKNIDLIIHETQRYWQLGFVMVAILLMVSCASTTKIEKSKLDSSIASNTNVTKKTDETQAGSITDKSEKAQDKKTESSENTAKVKETKITDYDPSKPIVPGTGKPPVVKETVTTEKEETQKSDKTEESLRQKLNLQVDYNKKLKQTVDSQSNVITKLKAKTETKVTTVSNWWKWLLTGMGIGALIIGLIMHFRWYEWFLNFIKKVFRR